MGMVCVEGGWRMEGGRVKTKVGLVTSPSKKKKVYVLTSVGFEPTPTNRLELESSSLDHSDIRPKIKGINPSDSGEIRTLAF